MIHAKRNSRLKKYLFIEFSKVEKGTEGLLEGALCVNRGRSNLGESAGELLHLAFERRDAFVLLLELARKS